MRLIVFFLGAKKTGKGSGGHRSGEGSGQGCMMLQVREITKMFKMRGLGLGREALAALNGHLEQFGDAAKEVERIIDCVKASGELTTSLVSLKSIEDALQTQGAAEENCGEDIMVLDHRAVPISEFDSVRQAFVRQHGSARSLAETAEGKAAYSRIRAFRERFQIIEQRVRRHKVFAKPAFAGSKTDRQELTSIGGLRRAEGTVCVLGLLTQPFAARFFLEDASHSIEVDLSQAKSSQGLFTENSIVIVEGYMQHDILIAMVLAMPPLEERSETAKFFPALAVPTDRAPYSDREAKLLLDKERADVDTEMVVLSDVWLDRPHVVKGLRHLLAGFDEMCSDGAAEGVDKKFIFVLMGNFTSVQSPGYDKHRQGFDELAGIIESLPSLLDSSMFIFVPGPNDSAAMGAGGDMLPRNAMPSNVTAAFKARIPSSEFTSSPCRIKFYTQEIVIHREDLCMGLRRHSRNPSEVEGTSLFVHAMQTVLKQGHLRPLPLHAGPIEWGFDHSLRLYPLPTVLFVGDRAEKEQCVIGGAKVANPGCFASDFTFFLYSPSPSGELVACQVSISDSTLGSVGEGGSAKKKRGKKSKDGKTRSKKDKEGKEGVQERTPKDRKEKKSRSKTSPPGIKETAGVGIGAFFAPRARMSLLQGEEGEEGERESSEGEVRRRKRVRRAVESDEGSSEESGEEEADGEGNDDGEEGGEGEGEGQGQGQGQGGGDDVHEGEGMEEEGQRMEEEEGGMEEGDDTDDM